MNDLGFLIVVSSVFIFCIWGENWWLKLIMICGLLVGLCVCVLLNMCCILLSLVWLIVRGFLIKICLFVVSVWVIKWVCVLWCVMMVIVFMVLLVSMLERLVDVFVKLVFFLWIMLLMLLVVMMLWNWAFVVLNVGISMCDV